ncbi:MAG: cytochrome c oxidase subunit 4 [Maribacter sp.]|jgi:cytochrome c oxidase subunit 4
MAHENHEDAIKSVYKGMILLGVVTLVEVAFSLFGKGHIVAGIENIGWVAYVIGFIIIVLSLYKAYFIVFEFMHMKGEAKGLAMTVLLPTLLLVWAVIAFFQEGTVWGEYRQGIKDKNAIESKEYFENPSVHQGVKVIDNETLNGEHKEDNH